MTDWWEGTEERDWDWEEDADGADEFTAIQWPEQERLPFEWEDYEE